MYVYGNPKTKKELKDWVVKGKDVRVFSPGLGEPPVNGETSVEGPHSPAAHTWYARVTIENGKVVKVK